MAGPMLGLYAISILIAWIFAPRKKSIALTCKSSSQRRLCLTIVEVGSAVTRDAPTEPRGAHQEARRLLSPRPCWRGACRRADNDARRARNDSQRDPRRHAPATTTISGDTGLWFVPTGEILPARNWSLSAYRVNFDYDQGFTDVSNWPVTFGFGVGGSRGAVRRVHGSRHGSTGTCGRCSARCSLSSAAWSTSIHS